MIFLLLEYYTYTHLIHNTVLQTVSVGFDQISKIISFFETSIIDIVEDNYGIIITANNDHTKPHGKFLLKK